MALTRIVQGRSATLTHTFQVGATATDPAPDVATVGITRDDGTVLVPAGTAATEAGTGVVTYTLTPTQTALLDVLTVTWTATFGGQPQAFRTMVEIRGDVLFSIADARVLSPLGNATTYPDATIAQARTLAETALEDACRVPFAPTYFRLTMDGDGRTDLLLPIVRPLSVTSVAVDGNAVDPTTVGLYDDGRLYLSTGWSTGWSTNWPAGPRRRRNVIVQGTYGFPYPPPRVSRAALLLAKRFLVDLPVSDRATSLTTQDGTTQFLVTAGVRQAVTDVPECNACIREYGVRAAFGIA